MPKNIFHCSSYTSLSHIDLCVWRACAAATFSVPDWLRKHLGPRNSVTQIGGPWRSPLMNFGALRPSRPLRFPRATHNLFNGKFTGGSRSRGSFSANRADAGTELRTLSRGTVTWPICPFRGDRTFLSVRLDLSVRCPRNTYVNEWDKLQASVAPDRPLGVLGAPNLTCR